MVLEVNSNYLDSNLNKNVNVNSQNVFNNMLHSFSGQICLKDSFQMYWRRFMTYTSNYILGSVQNKFDPTVV